MTAVLDTTPATSADQPTPGPALASWPSRAGALAVDVLPGLGVIATMVLLALASPSDGWERWVFTAAGGLTLFAMAVNRLVLPNAIGWTLGRALFGIAVHRGDGPVGIVRLTVRDLAHLLDTLALGIGWLWPLWDKRHRTFADMLTGTQVLRADPPQRNMRRVVATVLIAATVLSVAAAGLGYAVLYRYERGVETARQQIAEKGPRIVEQMLSYGADTLPDDFARAQGLTTDGYRDQLIAQQEAVKAGSPTTNEYWSVNSAVLTNPPVTPDHAAMLLAMQGQRGNNPDDVKFITATVLVHFDKSSDGQWRVANLTVLKKPQMNPAGQ